MTRLCDSVKELSSTPPACIGLKIFKSGVYARRLAKPPRLPSIDPSGMKKQRGTKGARYPLKIARNHYVPKRILAEFGLKVSKAVVAMLVSRAMEIVNMPITPSLYREVVGLVVRLRDQKISMERLKLERARFELDVAELVMKHIDKLKASGALQIKDRAEAARKIREELFGKYTKEQIDAAALSLG